MLVTGNMACEGLLVERISEGGCVDAWNQRSLLPRRVQPGDLILQVNGISQSPSKMVQEFACGDNSQIHFVVQRKTRRSQPALDMMQGAQALPPGGGKGGAAEGRPTAPAAGALAAAFKATGGIPNA